MELISHVVVAPPYFVNPSTHILVVTNNQLLCCSFLEFVKLAKIAMVHGWTMWSMSDSMSDECFEVNLKIALDSHLGLVEGILS